MHNLQHLPPQPLKPCQLLRWAICGLASIHGVQAATAAEVVPVPGAPAVANVQGVPVVNIAAPNAAGLSHNQFLDYNVERQGLVLNNALAAGRSQLAGQLGANPQLNRHAASLILNEVVSRNASSINGPQEVFGRAADYVLANPNGININGASFINTPRATFLVGSPELEGGRIERLSTLETRKALNVGERGLSNSAGAIDLIAPVINTQGDLTLPGDLNLALGYNRLRYDNRAIEHTRQVPAAPRVDAQLLGAMQAGRINIVSTAAGVGVRVAAPLTARDNLNITSAGNLDINDGGTRRTVLSSTRADVQLQAGADLRLKAADVNGRNIQATAGRNLQLDAGTRQDKTKKRENWEKKFWFVTTETYDKTLTQTRTEQRGSHLKASGDLSLKAGQDIDLKASTATAGGTLQAESGRDLRLTALNDSLDTRETVRHRKNLWRGDYDKTQKIETPRSSVLSSGGAMTVTSRRNVQLAGSEVQSRGDLTLEAGGKVDIGASRAVRQTQEKNYRGDLVSGAFFGNNTKNNQGEDRAVGSQVDTKGKLRISSDDVTITGSKVTGRQDALLISKSGVLTIDGATNVIRSDVSNTDSKLFGLLKDHSSTQKDATTQRRSQVTSQSNLRLQSARDLNVVASDVQAKGLLELNAAGDINVLAGQNAEKTVAQVDQHGFSATVNQTKDAAPGTKDSKQFQANLNYEQNEKTVTTDKVTHDASQLSGGTVNVTAGNTITVKGSDITATDGDLSLTGKTLQLLSATDTERKTVKDDTLNLGQYATGGMDRAGGGWQVGKEQETVITDTGTVKSSHLNGAGNVNLVADGGQGHILTEGAKVKAGETLTLQAGSVENRAVSDTVVETREGTRWNASIGGNIEYKDVTRPIQKVVEGVDQTKVYQPSVLDALDPPNAGVDLAVNVRDTATESGSGTAVVSEFEGGSVNILVGGALKDTGTRYVANDGVLSITAGSHDFAAAEDTTYQRDKGTDADVSLRVYTVTGRDISARVLGSGGSFDLQQTTRTAVPGSLEGKYGIQVQLGTDGRYEGTRFDAGKGDLKIRTPGSLTFTEARDRQTTRETTLGGFGWVEGGTTPDSVKKANAGGQIDKAGLTVEDSQGRAASLFAEGLTEIVAGRDLTLHGTQIGAPDKPSGDVRLKAGNNVEFLAGVDTHAAQGNTWGGGGRFSVKATQSDSASGKNGGIGAQGSLGKVDERSTLQRGGTLNSSGTVQIEGQNVRLQGLQGEAKTFELAATSGELILESARSDEQRDNYAFSAGLGLSASRSTDSASNGAGLFARGKVDIDRLDSQTHDNTRLQAGQIKLDSQGDTRLLGATLTAAEVTGSIGGDLLVESRQDQVKGLALNVDAHLTTEKNPSGAVDKLSVVGGPLAGKVKDKGKKLYEKAADKAGALKDRVLARSDRNKPDSRDRLKDQLFQNPGNRDTTPGLFADFSRVDNTTVAQASGIQGRERVELQVGGTVNLIGARIGSSNGAVDLGNAPVVGRDVNGRDLRTDLGINASASPLLLGAALGKEFGKQRDPQRLESEAFNLGLLRVGGHDQSQRLTHGIDQKPR